MKRTRDSDDDSGCESSHIETTTKRAPKKKRRVSFSVQSKTHDGLNHQNMLMDNLIRNLFVLRDTDLAADTVRQTENYEDLMVLDVTVKDLVKRIDASEKAVPALPKGGGGCFKLNKTHMLYLEWIQQRIQAAMTQSLWNRSSVEST